MAMSCCKFKKDNKESCENRNEGRYRNINCPRSMAFAVTSPCTDVGHPPKTNYMKPICCRSSSFRKFYNRGDLPIKVGSAKNIVWMVQIESVDYHYYLPLFFEGLSEIEFPYDLLAYRGAYEMINNSDGCRVLPVLHRLILPMKNALCTRNCKVIINALKLIQLMIVKENDIGVALVPYYRQLLGIIGLFKSKNVNIGDKVDFHHYDNLGDIINQTLEIMERCGGDNAFINIKYMIPTYESCMT